MKLIALGAVLLGGIFGFTAVNSYFTSATHRLPEFADGSGKVGTNPGHLLDGGELKPKAGDELAAFSGGCFWGTENIYRHVKGVVATAVGYTGGHVNHPTYEDVCTHTTGHAETVLVEFDPKVVSYLDLLKTFWENHDPTTPDRQGPDVGSNYRSAIWCYSPEELKIALASKARRQKLETAPITTKIEMAHKFWPAEDYHQQYDEKSGNNTCPIPNRVKGG
jgi:peptide-methionine (S)-S-oxide reductase